MSRILTGVGACVLIVGAGACQRSATAPASTGNAYVVSLDVQGRDRLAPGETAQFTAVARMSNGSTQEFTDRVAWIAGPPEVLTIARTTGVATARTAGDAVVWAEAGSDCCRVVRMAVLVLPPNTYRLTGRVEESGLPLPGATVNVVSGVGSGLTAITDYNGQYRLYGVAGAVQIKVSKPGYVDLVKEVTASANEVLDFPEARQAHALPSMSGSYMLTLQADSSCPVPSTDQRSTHLPADMQRARSYVVTLAQDGPALHVVGPRPNFMPPSDRFDGRATPGGAEFLLGNGYLGYGPDNAFTAYISPTQALSYEGYVYATREGSAIVGRLDGEIQFFEISNIARPIGSCRAANHRFSMTAAPGQTTR